ncbi:MAG: UvrD-helicase domain-containing protein [Bacteroidaceae bacterium]|nr:UvrD-helicase domain-containing protein [Bacteroidaceae bacterium]
MDNDYARELNESQLKAVEYNDGPSLVIAGAGSGKTRVLTYKIAHLMEVEGYKPWEILALTFTNKAAAEMKSRIATRVGEESARYLWMGTFHSLFAKILRREAETLGYTSNFTIYDQGDSRSLVKAIIKEMGLDDKVYKPNAVQARISEAKNVLLKAGMYYNDKAMVEEDMRRRLPAVRDIYQRYANRLKQADAMDFDDLLMQTYYLFENNKEILQRYRERFRYVLVDEYQDTNLAQHEIVWQLTAGHQHICVVGDDSQSIYSFRGARIDNILTFQSRYDSPKLFKLEENYRSTQTIVGAANSLIAHNQRRIPKEVFSNKEQGEPITVFEAAADKEEAGYVTRQLLSIRRRYGLTWSDFAILYRTNAQSRIFEEEFRKNGIDYRIYGGLSFYQRKEIKDIIAYFRVMVNPHDEEAFKRILNYPARGIGDTTLGHVVETASQAGVSLWEVIGAPEQYQLPVSKATQKKLEGFRSMMEEFRELSRTHDAYDTALDVVIRSGIKADIFSDMSDEGRSRQENVQELMDAMHDFVQSAREEGSDAIWLSDFLATVALLTDQDNPHDADVPRVTLMTVHSAKGLEFNTVFVVGLEEDLFPSNMAETDMDVEEERRLFYVALTRAEKRCLLTYAKTRFRYGQLQFGNRSRFLSEIDPCFFSGQSARQSAAQPTGRASGNHSAYPRPTVSPARNLVNQREQRSTGRWVSLGERSAQTAPSPAPSPSSHASSANATPSSSLRPGVRVEHERFGQGEVVSVEGVNENAKAVISFDNVGTKTLLLKFARLRVL